MQEAALPGQRGPRGCGQGAQWPEPRCVCTCSVVQPAAAVGSWCTAQWPATGCALQAATFLSHMSACLWLLRAAETILVNGISKTFWCACIHISEPVDFSCRDHPGDCHLQDLHHHRDHAQRAYRQVRAGTAPGRGSGARQWLVELGAS